MQDVGCWCVCACVCVLQSHWAAGMTHLCGTLQHGGHSRLHELIQSAHTPHTCNKWLQHLGRFGSVGTAAVFWQFSLQTAVFVLQVECNSKLDPTNTTFLKVDDVFQIFILVSVRVTTHSHICARMTPPIVSLQRC